MACESMRAMRTINCLLSCSPRAKQFLLGRAACFGWARAWHEELFVPCCYSGFVLGCPDDRVRGLDGIVGGRGEGAARAGRFMHGIDGKM